MTLIRIAIGTALLAALCAVTAATAVAAPVTLTANYTCTFPLITPQPVKLTITTDIPTSVPVGGSTDAFDIRAVAEVSPGATRGLTAVETATLEGEAIADASVDLPGGIRLPLKVPTTISKTNVPASGAFSVPATGQTPPLTFSQAGTAAIEVGDLVLQLTPRLGDGTLTGLEEFETECTQDPGQNATLATIVVGGGGNTVAYGYTLKGTSQLKTLTRGPVPLSGAIDAELTLATGSFAGDSTLNRTRARLQVLGLLPVTADIAFVQTDKTRGTLKDGKLTATARFKVRLPQLYLFGAIPITDPGKCQTKQASVATLRSTAAFFDPLAGGQLKGTYGLSDLTGCGLLEAFISPLTKGSGNTIDINLTPKA